MSVSRNFTSLFLYILALLLAVPNARAASATSCSGTLSEGADTPIAGAVVRLHELSSAKDYTATTSAGGRFDFPAIVPGRYEVSVTSGGSELRSSAQFVAKDEIAARLSLRVESGQLLLTQTGGMQESTVA